MRAFLHAVGCDGKVDKLQSTLYLLVDVFDLRKLGPWKHILHIAPPVALLTDFLHDAAGLLEEDLHGGHLELVEGADLLEAEDGFPEGDNREVELGNLLVVLGALVGEVDHSRDDVKDLHYLN